MPLFLQRPQAGEFNPYYEKYIARVVDGDVIEVLAHNADETLGILRAIPENTASYAYAEGKWTIKEVIGHVCDAERIFAYRMLRIGRGDQTPLASFDEKQYAPAGQFGQRTLASLIEEFAAVRAATIALVAGLPSEAWLRTGVASEWPVSARALAYIIAGHELHHREVLLTRYLPQISS
ncbi:MAG TPA: DinB family protein [Longimicrobiales bacterium]|nr:DinB family protein [Longimicrobiales bacterium]